MLQTLLKGTAAPLRVATLCLWALLVSCAPAIPVEQRQFEATVAKLLRDSDEVVVAAEQIAAFPWQRLCFERLNEVVLTFEDADSALTMRFDYRNIFIDEAYVAGSPEKKCITRQTPLRLKRMYPGNAETIGIYLDRQ